MAGWRDCLRYKINVSHLYPKALVFKYKVNLKRERIKNESFRIFEGFCIVCSYE